MNIRYFYLIIMLLLNINVFAQTQEKGYPKLMYVTAKDGLRERMSPSTNSIIKNTLVYGEHVQVFARQDKPVTINGITDYWYCTTGSTSEDRWAFGGYLSEELPNDLPVFLGFWDSAEEIEKNGYSWFFVDISANNSAYNSFGVGKKSSGNVSFGKWRIIEETNGNIFKIEVTHEWYDEDTGKVKSTTSYHKITIIDKDNILYKDSIRLKRNKTGD